MLRQDNSAKKLFSQKLTFMKKSAVILLLLFLTEGFAGKAQDQKVPEGFTSIFNGRDFTSWKVPVGDNGHWKILNGVWNSPPALVQFRNIYIKEI